MIYYVKGNCVYSCEISLCDEGFLEISEEEYYSRMSKAVSRREAGVLIVDNYDEM